MRDAAHDILVIEIIQLISNLEVVGPWVVCSVSSLKAQKVGSRNDYRRLFCDINHVQLLFQ